MSEETLGLACLIVLGVVVLVIGLIAIWMICTYNRLIGLRNAVRNNFAQIDVVLKRRYDLIPNLVETAKGYMKHERETLEAVIQARNSAASVLQSAEQNPVHPDNINRIMQAESVMTGALGRLFAVAEQYPDLKANTNMIQLMNELAETENRIAFSRQAYNHVVTDYNTAREVFPTLLIVATLGFQPATLFEAAEPERQNVKVAF